MRSSAIRGIVVGRGRLLEPEHAFRVRQRWLIGSFVFVLALQYLNSHSFAQSPGPLWSSAGRQLERTLVGWDGQSVEFESEAGKEFIPIDEFIGWGEWRVVPRLPWVVLADGSLVACRVNRVSGNEILGASGLWGELVLDRAKVTAVLLRPAAGLELRARQVFDLSERRTLDRVWLEGQDWIDGEIQSLDAESEGAVTLLVPRQEEPLRIPLERIWALSFRAPEDALAGEEQVATWTLGLSDGSWLRLREWSAEDFVWRGITTEGVALSYEVRGDDSSWLKPIRAVYRVPLASQDLLAESPLQEGQVGWLGADWLSQSDRRPDRSPLQVDRAWFPRGRGVVGSSTLVYRLSEGTRRIRWRAGVDDASPVRQAEIRIFLADEQGVWQDIAAMSRPIVRGQPAQGGEVTVSGARFVAINVQAAARVGPAPLVDWLELTAISQSEPEPSR